LDEIRREEEIGELAVGAKEDNASVACRCLATFKKSSCCSVGMSKCLASNSATCREGRRSSDSILKINETEQPSLLASSCCVKSKAFRLRLTQVPNE
jgi:hypothetical protein